MKKIIIILLLLGFGGLAIYGQLRANQFRDQAFRADSIAAAADTARMLALATLDSTTNAWQRRIVQVELRADSIDRELRLRPVVEIPGELRIDTLRIYDTVPAAPPENDSIQEYRFEGDDGPFQYIGGAAINIFQRRGIFDVNIYQDEPALVRTRVSCGAEAGVRSAHVTMFADDPFSLVPGQVQADPDVCNPPQRFSLVPEISLKGLGWEAAKGAGWILLYEGLKALTGSDDPKYREPIY